jgi:hypothetical protein
VLRLSGLKFSHAQKLKSMNNPPIKFFVDAQRPDGRWVLGEIACTRAEAETRAGELKLQHPDWLVEINPVSASKPDSKVSAPPIFVPDPQPTVALATDA